LALINATPLPIFAVALVTPFLRTQHRRAIIAGRAALSVFIVSICIAPWLVRNAVVLGSLVPLRSNLGVELWQGNNPNGSIRQQEDSAHPAHEDSPEYAMYNRLGEIAYSRLCWDRASAYIRSHPFLTIVRAAERFYVVWCTDIFDQWPYARGWKWWHGDPDETVLRFTTILSALLPLGLVLYGVLSGSFRSLPHGALFATVFLVLPLPHYLTQVADHYFVFMRCWLVLLGVTVALPRPIHPEPHRDRLRASNARQRAEQGREDARMRACPE
jgi:hypothetical protein